MNCYADAGASCARVKNSTPTEFRLSGFTIVELLIVIVILGILAALVITVFRGVQEQAYNARIISAVKQYHGAIEQYRVLHSRYPATGPENNGDTIAVVCLGAGYVDAHCGSITNTEVYEDSVFNENMNEVLKNRPKVNDQQLPAGPEDFVGAVYGNDYIWSEKGYHTEARTIQYALHGANQDCKLPGAWAYRSTTSPRATTACIIELELYE